LIIPLFRPFSSIIEDRPVGRPHEGHIRRLQDYFWSDADPDGLGFVPLADALRQAGDFGEAHRLLRDGLGRHPDFLSGHVVAAWLSVDQGQLEDAESRFRTALELDPQNIFALRGLAEILLDRGDEGSALGFLEALLQEDPIDLNLPERVLELRTRAEAAPEAGWDADLEPAPAPTVWDDPDAVAEELNWGVAALQRDSSSYGSANESERVAPSASVVEDGEPIPAPEELDDALATSTLGEIYLRQGLFGRADRLFETLLAGDPENAHLKHRLEEARSLLHAQEAKPDESERRTPPEEEIVTIASLAPDDGQDALPGVGASGEIVAIEALAPEEIVPIEALAPVEVVPIESLAPDRLVPVLAVEPARDDPVSIAALAPDEPVSIAALAPDDPVSIAALAPDEPVSIAALAPDEPDSGQDSTVDAFENWLDNLK
jgi:tetratricopeptide (TPR) repeat protein